MKFVLVLFLLAGSAVAFACGDDATQTPEQTVEQKAAFCAEVVKLQAEVDAFRALGPGTTKEQIGDAIDAIRLQVINVGEAAAPIHQERLETMEASQRALQESIQAIPDASSPEEALASVQDEFAAFQTANQAMTGSADCP